MPWLYLIANAALLVAAGLLGWRTRRLRATSFVAVFAVAAGLALLRLFLAAHPEHEQLLLRLSDDYLYFSDWDAPLAAFMAMALGARLHGRARRVVPAALAALGPLFLSGSITSCLQPDYAMATRLDEDGICRQTTDYSCGPAAAVTVLRSAGRTMSESEMARLCLLRHGEGVTALEVCRGLGLALRPIQLHARIRRVDSAGLHALRRPFLAEVNRSGIANHCVAVLEVRPDTVLLGDPARGRTTCSMKHFLRQWTGIAITVEPGDRGA